jgi:O-antigen/teichoic acid export membrane protein
LFRAIRGSLASLVGATLFEAGTSFIVFVLLARTLSVGELGQVVFAQSLVGLVFALADPRIEDTVIRYVPQIARQYGGESASRFFRRALGIDCGVGVGAAAVVLLAVGCHVVERTSRIDPRFLVLSALLAGTQAALGTATAGFAVTDRLSRLGGFRAIAATLSALILIPATIAGGAVGYLAAAAVVAAVTTVIAVALSVRLVDDRFGRPDRHSAVPRPPGVVSYTVQTSLASSAAIGFDLLPLSVLGVLSTASRLAQFRVALAPNRLALSAASPVSGVLFPRLSSHSAASDHGAIRREILGWTTASGVAAVVAGATAWVALPVLLPLVYGHRFSVAVPAARLLVLAALVRIVTAWSKTFPLAIGRPGLRLLLLVVDGAALVFVTALFARRPIAWLAGGQLVVAIVVSAIWLAIAWRYRGATAGVHELGYQA